VTLARGPLSLAERLRFVGRRIGTRTRLLVR